MVPSARTSTRVNVMIVVDRPKLSSCSSDTRGEQMSRNVGEPVSALPTGVSVVVPVYNGAPTLVELARRIDAALEGRGSWELIFVVDGSPDDSWAVVEKLVGADRHIRGINLFRNFGQHNALLAGIRHATYDVVVTMDDDLQHRPEMIPVLLDGLSPDVDLVYGAAVEDEHSWWRNLASRFTKAAMGASIGGRMARDSSAFRAFRTSLRDGFTRVDDPYVSMDVLLSWVTIRYTTVDTPMDQRHVGSSGYTFRSLVRHAINMITGYSTKPLRFVAWLGFGMAFFGLAALAYVLVRYFTSGSAVPGFAFIASLVAILAGAQLFGLGVIGEYLGRMHFRSMQRPTYVVRETIEPDDPAED
jgi:glycosyltransferase involved in cell wall biosynthesis